MEGREDRSSDDVWALGLILYEMLAGYHPYRELENAHALASIVTSTQQVPQMESCGHIPFEGCRLLRRNIVICTLAEIRRLTRLLSLWLLDLYQV